jgi:hypothetical protein
MALIYQATLAPSKIELLSGWVPAQSWVGDADVSTLEAVGSYRFDDPAGDVGIETHLLRAAGGQLFQVPLTYRNDPLAGAESALLGTMQHSVLGERWVYDGCADSVYLTALATAILTGGSEAAHEVVTDKGNVPRPTTTRVLGSGSPDIAVPALGPVTYASEATSTVITMTSLTLVVLRAIEVGNANDSSTDTQILSGTWPGNDVPALLAVARLR